MTRPRTKIALALASTAVACAVLVPLWLRWQRGRADVIGFRRVGPAALPAGAAPEIEPGSDARWPSVLDLEHPRFPPSTFAREPLSPAEVAACFATGTDAVYDPWSYYRHAPGLARENRWAEHPRGRWTMRTNSLGLREDDEPSAELPDLRVLCTGDSHTDGVCDNAESFVNVLEAELGARHPSRRVECLNDGHGGYSFFNYLGSLERHIELRPDAFVVTIYGGNDFEDALTLHHRFRGTERPPGSASYWPEVERALAASAPSLAQAFLSLKYFAVHPSEQETALQAARDVCTEIEVVCRRHAVRPVFVYLPPATDAEWQRHREAFDRVRDALGLRPEDLASTERMADSLLLFLRTLRADVVDLRASFRAHEGPLYWVEDFHVNLDAQRLIARELAPLFEPDLALPRPRARRAPGSAPEAADRERLLAPGAPGPSLAALAGTPLPQPAPPFELHPLRGERARAAFVLGPDDEPDERAVFRYRAGLDVERTAGARIWRMRTDATGLRRAAGRSVAGAETAASPPDRPGTRVLVLGGAQVDGPWPDEERLPALLAAELAAGEPEGAPAEVLDASHARYSFHNYEGCWESRRALAPDVVVLAVDGGDDFAAAAELVRWLPEPDPGDGALLRLRERLADLAAREPAALARELAEIELLRLYPREQRSSLRNAIGAVLAIEASAREASARLVVVWFPPAGALDAAAAARIAAEGAALGWRGDEPRTLAVAGERFVAELRRRGIDVVDAGAIAGAAYDPEHLLADLATRRAAAAEVARRLSAPEGGDRVEAAGDR